MMETIPSPKPQLRPAMRRLLDDIDATRRDPTRPLATPPAEILDLLSDSMNQLHVQRMINKTEDDALRVVLQWFVRGLAVQQLEQANTYTRWAANISRSADKTLNILVPVAIASLCIGVLLKLEDPYLTLLYIAWGTVVAALSIGPTSKYFLSMRAYQACAMSRKLSRIVDDELPRQTAQSGSPA